MNNTIKCKYCGRELEITEALRQQIEEQVLSDERARHTEELKEAREQAEKLGNEKAAGKFELALKNLQEEAKEEKERNKELQAQILNITKELRKAREDKEKQEIEIQNKLNEAVKQAEKQGSEKAYEKFELKVNTFQEEIKEEKQRNKELQEQILEISKELRKARQEREAAALEMQKKLNAEAEKIRLEARKQAEEEYQLKDFEKDKKLQDVLKINEELKRKLEQGSQQMQGEVLELEIEKLLQQAFPEDRIEEVKKGQRGADIKHTIFDKRGRECGMILWETKNAQWNHAWIKKLREDQREAKAQLGVLVSADLPKEIEGFAYCEGVWITGHKLVAALATAIRFNLINLQNERS